MARIFPFVFGMLLLILPHGTAAQRYDMVPFYRAHALELSLQPVLLDALRAQNRRNARFDRRQIPDLEAAWRRTRDDDSAPMIAAVVGTDAAAFLRGQIATSAGHLTEAILMDAYGLNVAAARTPSDLWQGDEAKYTETVEQGRDGLHVGQIEFDASTGGYQTQISVSVIDPDTDKVIGALTLGIAAWSLL